MKQITDSILNNRILKITATAHSVILTVESKGQIQDLDLRGTITIESSAASNSALCGRYINQYSKAGSQIKISLDDGTKISITPADEFTVEHSSATNPLLLTSVENLIQGSVILSTWLNYEMNTLALSFANGCVLTILNPFSLEPYTTLPTNLEDRKVISCRITDDSFELATETTLLRANLQNPDPEAMIFTVPWSQNINRKQYVVWN